MRRLYAQFLVHKTVAWGSRPSLRAPSHGRVPKPVFYVPKTGRKVVRVQFLVILAKLCVMVFCQKLNDGRGGDGLRPRDIKKLCPPVGTLPCIYAGTKLI